MSEKNDINMYISEVKPDDLFDSENNVEDLFGLNGARLRRRVPLKGETWDGSNISLLREINFDLLEDKTGLVVNSHERERIKEILLECLCRHRESEDLPGSQKVKGYLQKFVNYSLFIESAIEYDAPGKLSEEEYDKMKLYFFSHLIPTVSCSIAEPMDGEDLPRLEIKRGTSIRGLPDREDSDIIFDAKVVVDFLAMCRASIQEYLKESDEVEEKKGPKSKDSFIVCLKQLYGVYKNIGGAIPGFHRSRDDEKYGVFLVFAQELLHAIGFSFKKCEIYNKIVKNKKYIASYSYGLSNVEKRD